VAAVAQPDSVPGANSVQTQDQVSQLPPSAFPQSTAHALTNEQYNQLMLLLSQQATNQERASNADMRAPGFSTR